MLNKSTRILKRSLLIGRRKVQWDLWEIKERVEELRCILLWAEYKV